MPQTDNASFQSETLTEKIYHHNLISGTHVDGILNNR